jgi:hypothetical protein
MRVQPKDLLERIYCRGSIRLRRRPNQVNFQLSNLRALLSHSPWHAAINDNGLACNRRGVHEGEYLIGDIFCLTNSA